MKFKKALREAVWILLTEGRVSRRRLSQEFGLSPEALEALCFELIEVKGWAVDESADVLAWRAGQAMPRPQTTTAGGEAPRGERNSEGERRQLTVMFCDLIGSTALSTQLDPEDMQKVITTYQETVAPVIENLGGFIAKYMGDGILIYFGYPQGLEKDAERAVHAGLSVIEAMAELNDANVLNIDAELAVRIGIATGTVVVGESLGEGMAQEKTVVGDTPNLAARLQGLAKPNGIVISDLTRELSGDKFEYEDLGLQALKGIEEPTVAWAVLGEQVEEFDGETGFRESGAPLVGRKEELGLLLRAWQQSKDNSGQVVAINGEAGIGKSRLIEAISAEVRKDGQTRITLRSTPYHSNSALYPVTTHLQHALGWKAGEEAESRLAKLENALADFQFKTAETVPLLAALFSLAIPEGRHPVLNLTPPQQRLSTLDTIVAWLLEEAERRPILVVWEDIHWADPSTLELLEMMIEQCPTVGMLICLTFRPEFVPSWPTRSHIVPLTLNRLERPEVEALIAHHVGGKKLPAEVVEHIFQRGDGVPLYVSELTRAILASGSLRETDDSYELTGPLQDLEIPATLQESLMARLDKMPTVREVAQLGAVFGREFPYDMLQAVATLEEPALREGLGQLVEAELLYQRGRPPQAKYMFKHALIQDAAYQSLLKRTRQQYHRDVAALLATRFADTVETQPEILAHHYTEAGENGPATDYWLQAGQMALERSSNHEAIGHLMKGLTLLPEDDSHAGRELVIQRQLGTALMATKGYGAPETGRAFDRARELCAIVTDDDSIYPVLFGVWVSGLTRANHASAFEVAVEMYERASKGSDKFAQLTSHLIMGCSQLHMGALLDARDHLERAAVLFPGIDKEEIATSAVRYGLEMGATYHAYAAWCEWLLGYPDRALQLSRTSLALQETSDHLYTRSRALYWNAVVHEFCGDQARVLELADAAIATAKEHGLPLVVAVGRIMQAAADAALNETEGAAEDMAKASADYTATGARFQSVYHCALLATTLKSQGRRKEAREALTDARHLIQETGESYYDAEILRLKAELQGADGDHAAAETGFLEALAVARAQDAKSLELRAATSLARLWQSQGRTTEARDLLFPVHGWFTEGFETRDLIDATALLDELG